MTPTEATFAIPSSSTANWTLNLWSAGQLLGTESGTGGAGPLTVTVPAGTDCHLQVDVLRNGTYFAGAAKKFTSCGPTTVVTTTTELTPPTTTPTPPGGSTTTTVIPVTGGSGGSGSGGSSTPGSSSSLPFTGPGPGLWLLLLAGLVLVDLGTVVLLVQPARVALMRRVRARGSDGGTATRLEAPRHVVAGLDGCRRHAPRRHGARGALEPPDRTPRRRGREAPRRDTLWLDGP